MRRFVLAGWLLAALVQPATCGPRSATKHLSFDSDPGWEGFNNRLRPEALPIVTEDYGFSPQTNFAAKDKGEIGGRVTRCFAPTYYATATTKTLNDKLTASGTFAVTSTAGSSGVFFGWFNSAQQEGSGRPVNSLGMDFDGEGGGARLAVRMINRTNKSCGTFITPFVPGKFRPTPIRRDGTRYAWTLTYDPDANGGNGRFNFTIKTDRADTDPLHASRLPADLPEAYRQEALRRFPNTTEFSVDLPAGFRQEGAKFDRFGMMNMMKPGNSMTIYFGDLEHDGITENLTRDPEWIGLKNRATIQTVAVGAHDFGYSANTRFAGGQAGEIGGDIWRGGKPAYYADRFEPLTLNDPLEASGKVILKVGAPDSDMFIGWFDSAMEKNADTTSSAFIGVHVGGPTRVGHYFSPTVSTGDTRRRGISKDGPLLTPNRTFDWSLIYNPAANGGNGEMRVTLGTESVTLVFKRGVKTDRARLDRFGIFTSPIGGQMVRIFFDDLTYTAR